MQQVNHPWDLPLAQVDFGTLCVLVFAAVVVNFLLR